MRKSKKYTYYIFTSLTAIAILIACAVNPVTGKKEISLMSEAQEAQLGAQSDPSIVAQFGLYQDDEMQAFIEEKGQEMAAISHRSNLNYEFKVLNSPVVNAFAVPGGYVYFTRGIMAHFNNEAEFAGVLGLEMQMYLPEKEAGLMFLTSATLNPNISVSQPCRSTKG